MGEEQGEKYLKQIAETIQAALASGTSTYRRSQSGRCFLCGERGHYRRFCPKANASSYGQSRPESNQGNC